MNTSLKNCLQTLGSTWFTSLRQGGVDHSLFIGKPMDDRKPYGRPSTGIRHRDLPAESGNFILIKGLPLLFNSDKIVERAKVAGVDVKRSFWGKNKDSEFRFIIETVNPVPLGEEGSLLLLPKLIFGYCVDYFSATSVSEWEDTADTSSSAPSSS